MPVDSTPQTILDDLMRLLPAQFEILVVRLSIPPEYLPTGVPQAARAVEVIKYLQQQDRLAEAQAQLRQMLPPGSPSPDQRRRRRGLVLRVAFLAILGGSLLANAWIATRWPELHDPALFNGDGAYPHQIARMYSDESRLVTGSQIKRVLDGTHESFMLMSLTGAGVIRQSREQLVNALRRGVKFRFMLMDPRAAQRQSYDWFFGPLSPGIPVQYRGASVEVLTILQELKQRCGAGREFPNGEIRVALSPPPHYMSLWARDPTLETGIAHVGLYSTRGPANDMAFRVSRDDRVARQAIVDEFASYWSHADELRDDGAIQSLIETLESGLGAESASGAAVPAPPSAKPAKAQGQPPPTNPRSYQPQLIGPDEEARAQRTMLQQH